MRALRATWREERFTEREKRYKLKILISKTPCKKCCTSVSYYIILTRVIYWNTPLIIFRTVAYGKHSLAASNWLISQAYWTGSCKYCFMIMVDPVTITSLPSFLTFKKNLLEF